MVLLNIIPLHLPNGIVVCWLFFKINFEKNLSVTLLECQTVRFRSGPEVIKLFTCSTQLSMGLQLLLKAKMLKNRCFSCFKALIYCIDHDYKC